MEFYSKYHRGGVLAVNSLEVRHGNFLLIEKAGGGRGRAGSVGEEGRGLRPAGWGRRGGAGRARQEGGGTTRPPGVSNVEEGEDTGSVFNNVGF